MAQTDDYKVYWPDGDHIVVSTFDLESMNLDFASWLRFLQVLQGKRRFAAVTMRVPNRDPQELKIMPLVLTTSETTFKTLV
jgi:hypothetical protein